jgi:hypothetical protein
MLKLTAHSGEYMGKTLANFSTVLNRTREKIIWAHVLSSDGAIQLSHPRRYFQARMKLLFI